MSSQPQSRPGAAGKLPILGGRASTTLLDICPFGNYNYMNARRQPEHEFPSTAFAIQIITGLLDACMEESGKEFTYSIVPETPPSDRSRRRVDLVVRAWTWGPGQRAEQFTLMHVEVKRHGATTAQVEDLENQIVTACQATDQDLVYAMAFHGTSVRVWSYIKPYLVSMTGADFNDTSEKANWIDAQNVEGTSSVLGAVWEMVERPPKPLLQVKSGVKEIPKEVWEVAKGKIVHSDKQQSIPIPTLSQGRPQKVEVMIEGRLYALSNAVLLRYGPNVVDDTAMCKQLENAFALSYPKISAGFTKALRSRRNRDSQTKQRRLIAKAFNDMEYFRFERNQRNEHAKRAGQSAGQELSEEEEDEDEEEEEEEDSDDGQDR